MNYHFDSETWIKEMESILENVGIAFQIKNDLNDYLKNKFAEDFELSSQITIEEGIDTDEFAVFSRKGNYLFSLKQPF
mgnify:CR=1 FL=1